MPCLRPVGIIHSERLPSELITLPLLSTWSCRGALPPHTTYDMIMAYVINLRTMAPAAVCSLSMPYTEVPCARLCPLYCRCGTCALHSLPFTCEAGRNRSFYGPWLLGWVNILVIPLGLLSHTSMFGMISRTDQLQGHHLQRQLFQRLGVKLKKILEETSVSLSKGRWKQKRHKA